MPYQNILSGSGESFIKKTFGLKRQPKIYSKCKVVLKIFPGGDGTTMGVFTYTNNDGTATDDDMYETTGENILDTFCLKGK